MATFKELQYKFGFDPDAIERMRLAARGSSSVPCIQPSAPVIVKHDRLHGTPLLKRSDGSLMAFTGMCYTSLYQLERDGKFPARRQISPGRVAWIKAEVQEWMDSMPAAAPFPIKIA